VLLRTLFILGCLIVLGNVIVHACGALARAAVHRVASRAADRAAASALTSLQQTLATAIANGADPRTVSIPPQTTPSVCALGGASCLLFVRTAVRSTMLLPVGSADASQAACEPRCAFNLQGNDAVDEGRLSALISSIVSGPAGTMLARRDRYVSLRTLRSPPYVAIAGSRDATDDRFRTGSAQGDDGGAHATIVSVKYRNALSRAEMDGNAWQSRPWSADDAPAGWSP
jgi:hypothetical protein